MQTWQSEPGRHFGEPDEEKGVNWLRYVSALRRFKWLVVMCAAAGVVGGYAATKMVTPQYETHATIWLPSTGDNSRRQGQNGPIEENQPVNDPAGWLDLFKSLSVTDSVVMKRRLYVTYKPINRDLFALLAVSPNFKAGDYLLTVPPNSNQYVITVDPNRMVVERGTLGDSVGRNLGLQWHPSADALRAAAPLGFWLQTPEHASAQLLSRLTATLPAQSNFMALTLAGSSPTEVAATLNEWTQDFIAMEADLKRARDAELTNRLGTQVKAAGDAVTKAAHALEEYETSTIVQSSSVGGSMGSSALSPTAGSGSATGANPSLTTYVSQTTQRDNLNDDIARLKDILANAKLANHELNPEDLLSVSSLGTGAEDLIGAITDYRAKAATLRELQQKYTNQYKPVVQAQAEVNTLRDHTIPMLAQQALSRLQLNADNLTKRINAATSAMQKLPEQTLRDDSLKRDYTQANLLYSTLQDKYHEAQIAEETALPDVRVLDKAIAPRSPSVNTAPRVMLMVLVTGIGLGIVLALLLDRMDPRLRYPEQATDDLGLPIIGTVPGVRRRRHRSQAANLEEQAQLVESFRTIRLNLLNLYEPGTAVTATLTSPGAGEGKSFVASNLALSFAEGGFRTLLVDADVRRGHLHSTFSVKQSPGLLEYLLDKASLNDIMQTTGSRNLTVIAGGTRRNRGPELLASAGTLQFLHAVRSQFDVVIIDSPPLGAGIDAFALAAATGNSIVVLRIGRSDRKMAEAKLAVLDRYPVRQLGAVLNDVKASGVFRYYSYVAGYGVEDLNEAQEGQESLEVGRIAAPAE